MSFSLPAGSDAFTSILACGGNQIRCGATDYRVAATESGISLSCTVSRSARFHVDARLSKDGGPTFAVTGDLDDSGGTVTISLSSGADGGAAGPISCNVTSVPFVNDGTVWATFACGNADAGPCDVHGTFVFEQCITSADAGPPPQ